MKKIIVILLAIAFKCNSQSACNQSLCYPFLNSDYRQIAAIIKSVQTTSTPCTFTTCAPFLNSDLKQIYGLIKGLGTSTTVTGWSLLGNTTTSLNFLGTTNAQSLFIKTNNIKTAEFNATGDYKFSGSFLDNLNAPAIGIYQRTMYDNAALTSLDWANRQLYDPAGNVTFDWHTPLILKFGGVTANYSIYNAGNGFWGLGTGTLTLKSNLNIAPSTTNTAQLWLRGSNVAPISNLKSGMIYNDTVLDGLGFYQLPTGTSYFSTFTNGTNRLVTFLSTAGTYSGAALATASTDNLHFGTDLDGLGVPSLTIGKNQNTYVNFSTYTLSGTFNVNQGVATNIFQVTNNATTYFKVASGGVSTFNAPLTCTTTIAAGGNFSLTTSGSKINVKTGSNQSAGTCTLSSGTVTIANTLITANSLILTTARGTLTPLPISVTTAAGVGFTVTSSSVTDGRVVNYLIIENN